MSPFSTEIPHGPKDLVGYDAISPFLVWGLIGLILGTILMGLFLYFKPWKRFAKHKDKTKDILEELDDLNPLVFLEKNTLPEFFHRLTSLLKKFLEESYRFHAAELTTRELNLQLRKQLKMLDSQTIESMLSFFKFADLIKFSKAKSNPEDCQNYLSQVRQWVVMIKKQLSEQKIQEK